VRRTVDAPEIAYFRRSSPGPERSKRERSVKKSKQSRDDRRPITPPRRSKKRARVRYIEGFSPSDVDDGIANGLFRDHDRSFTDYIGPGADASNTDRTDQIRINGKINPTDTKITFPPNMRHYSERVLMQREENGEWLTTRAAELDRNMKDISPSQKMKFADALYSLYRLSYSRLQTTIT